jgi:hypothetical protein
MKRREITQEVVMKWCMRLELYVRSVIAVYISLLLTIDADGTRVRVRRIMHSGHAESLHSFCALHTCE